MSALALMARAPSSRSHSPPSRVTLRSNYSDSRLAASAGRLRLSGQCGHTNRWACDSASSDSSESPRPRRSPARRPILALTLLCTSRTPHTYDDALILTPHTPPPSSLIVRSFLVQQRWRWRCEGITPPVDEEDEPGGDGGRARRMMGL